MWRCRCHGMAVPMVEDLAGGGVFFFFSSRRRHTRCSRDWSSDVCSSDLVVITVAFIGYLVAGPLGATVAAIGVFAPVYFVTVLAAPHFRRFAESPRIKAFVDGVTAAATGAIAGAVLVLAPRAPLDVPTVLICPGTLPVLLTLQRVS